MMDERDVIEIVRRELDEREAARPPACEYQQMMPVCEFAAQDDDGRPLRVMGIALRDDGMPEWIVAIHDADGALVPEIATCVWENSG